MTLFSRLLRGLSGTLGFIASAFVLLLILHVAIDVVMRNVFNAPIIGTIEFVSNFYMIGITFLPLALVERRDAHISVEVLTEMMPAKVVHVLLILATLLAVVAMGMLCWRSWLEAMSNYRRDTVLLIAGGTQLPIWQSYFALPLGFGAACLAALYKLVCLLTGRPFTDEEEAAALAAAAQNAAAKAAGLHNAAAKAAGKDGEHV